jgi:hypothetical protein
MMIGYVSFGLCCFVIGVYMSRHALAAVYSCIVCLYSVVSKNRTKITRTLI